MSAERYMKDWGKTAPSGGGFYKNSREDIVLTFFYYYLSNKCSKKILYLEIICYIMDERDKIRLGMGVLS